MPGREEDHVFFWYLFCGLLAGVLGGMGMGGGTVLIPLLTIFLDVSQRAAQGINILSFLPMAGVSLGLHFKNKLVDTRGVLWLILPACLCSAAGALLSGLFDNNILHRIFGGFLILLSVFQILAVFVFNGGQAQSQPEAISGGICNLPDKAKKIRSFQEK